MAPSELDTKPQIVIGHDLVVAAGLGHAIGDALGVPVEFMPRHKLDASPVTGMRSFGTHCMPQGVWSDDTSMTIALIASLLSNYRFNYDNIMDNFVDWRYHGDFTAGGAAFDIGGTCSRALHNFVNGTPALEAGPSSEHANGNGSLMRIMPISFIAHQRQLSAKDTYDLTAKVSKLTHGHVVSILGCYLYVWYIRYLLEGSSPEEAYQRLQTDTDWTISPLRAHVHYGRLLDHNIADCPRDEIGSSGYVVTTLESALWSLLRSENYEDAVLTAVNLGEDTDTIAAVTGALAGIAYGLDSIPPLWLDQLERKDYLEDLYRDFASALPTIRV